MNVKVESPESTAHAEQIEGSFGRCRQTSGRNLLRPVEDVCWLMAGGLRPVNRSVTLTVWQYEVKNITVPTMLFIFYRVIFFEIFHLVRICIYTTLSTFLLTLITNL